MAADFGTDTTDAQAGMRETGQATSADEGSSSPLDDAVTVGAETLNEAVERTARARLHIVETHGRATLAHEKSAQLLEELAARGGPQAPARRAAAARHRARANAQRRAAARRDSDPA